MMNQEIKKKILLLNEMFSSTSKKKTLFLSTTANLNNPETYIASKKETSSRLIAHIILRSFKDVPEIIKEMGVVFESILVDTEIKGEYRDLYEDATQMFGKDLIIGVKPNDFTVNAIDALFAKQNLNGWKISILGTGNIGSKLCIKLIERGANCSIQSRNILKLEKIRNGIETFKSGTGSISCTTSITESVRDADAVVNCAPGIPILMYEHVQMIKKGAIIIDVGNGTIDGSAIEYILNRDIKLYIMNSLPGLVSELSCIEKSDELISNLKRKKLSEKVSVITTGILGKKGDVIVDNIDNIKNIVGVCDGRGDLLKNDEASKYLEELYGYLKK